jgi:hypothetical protein
MQLFFKLFLHLILEVGKVLYQQYFTRTLLSYIKHNLLNIYR